MEVKLNYSDFYVHVEIGYTHDILGYLHENESGLYYFDFHDYSDFYLFELLGVENLPNIQRSVLGYTYPYKKHAYFENKEDAIKFLEYIIYRYETRQLYKEQMKEDVGRFVNKYISQIKFHIRKQKRIKFNFNL